MVSGRRSNPGRDGPTASNTHALAGGFPLNRAELYIMGIYAASGSLHNARADTKYRNQTSFLSGRAKLHIFLDESGSFVVPQTAASSISAMGALAIPEC